MRKLSSMSQVKPCHFRSDFRFLFPTCSNMRLIQGISLCLLLVINFGAFEALEVDTNLASQCRSVEKKYKVSQHDFLTQFYIGSFLSTHLVEVTCQKEGIHLQAQITSQWISSSTIKTILNQGLIPRPNSSHCSRCS